MRILEERKDYILKYDLVKQIDPAFLSDNYINVYLFDINNKISFIQGKKVKSFKNIEQDLKNLSEKVIKEWKTSLSKSLDLKSETEDF